MSFPLYQVSDLSEFTGQPMSLYSPFAVQALAQSTLLFMVVTELETDEGLSATDSALSKSGILAMADQLYLEQPYRGVAASPFQEESVGSYHWSKPVTYARGTAAALALKGESTGVMWWDMAVQTLALRTRRGGVFFGSIPFMELEWNDSIVADLKGELSEDGRPRILGPADMNKTNGIFYDVNGESWPGGAGTSFSLSPGD